MPSYSVLEISPLRISPYSEVSFFYCDPPYFSTESYYENVGFTTADHERLRDSLKNIGSTPKVVEKLKTGNELKVRACR